ncbi:MAG: class I SAM-dependent methyltransferase [Mariniblastus sp.]|nr:class I SAM-dependent methyltransferase [Mariniblastus sp.]
MQPSDPVGHNRSAWNQMARQRNRFSRPARDEDFVDPLKSVDGPGWLGGNIQGKRVLCLAAGGGRQGPIYAAAGGIVTVVDISGEMLKLDRDVARQRNLEIRVVEQSMDDLSCFEPASFDIVIQPVSTCYIPNIENVYCQVARVMEPDGIYISQHKQPTSLQVENDAAAVYRLGTQYYRSEPLTPARTASLVREAGTYEYIHRWQELIGSMCRAGFVIEDLTEPLHADGAAEPGSFGHRSNFVAPYVRIKARRTCQVVEVPGIWTPER